MQNKQANDILSAWILVEEVSGGEIDKTAVRIVGKRAIAVQAARDAQGRTKTGKDSLVYLGEYRKQAIRNEIQQKIFKDPTMVQNEDPAVGYSVALTVDDHWHFMKIFVPHAAYFYLQLRLGNRQEAMKHTLYDDFVDKLQQQIEEIINDDHLAVADALHQVNRLVNKEFRCANNEANGLQGILNYVTEPALMNSFYLDDLQKILGEHQDDPMLMNYLQRQPTSHIDIDENWDFITQLLVVDNLPDGRWPSQVEFFQSLMQQVAINVIQDKAGVKSDLRTVNGPPGTGKTTLLKDVFADMVVSQAKVIAQLDQPTDGFKKIDQVTLFSKYSYSIYELIPELQGYGVVVTSNNNSAVANISKDFPAKSEIQQHVDASQPNDYLTELMNVDYFSEAADHILQSSESWGLFAVPMGSRTKQKAVFEYLNRKPSGSSLTRLKQMLTLDATEDTWSAAKQDFKAALQVVTDLKQQLAKDIASVKNYDASKLAAVEEQISALDIDAQQQIIAELTAKIEAQERRLDLEPQKRVMLFMKRDTPAREQLKADLSANYQQQIEAKEALQAAQHELTILQQQRAALQQLAAKIQPLRTKLSTDKTHAITPDYWQQDNAKRQMQLPNNSLALQDARAELFIAAIRLRKVFACGACKQISNAWTLFENQNRLPYPQNEHNLVASFQIMQLLIPVMSTTLASVKTMFANMPANSIDNVFIDESGQATPASVVGILWRAKRLVAVGDPAQIEPVVTMDEPTLRMIADEYNVESKYLLPTTSVQQLADDGSTYGMQKSANEWVGMPL